MKIPYDQIIGMILVPEGFYRTLYDPGWDFYQGLSTNMYEI